jgi:hypothetical protein
MDTSLVDKLDKLDNTTEKDVYSSKKNPHTDFLDMVDESISMEEEQQYNNTPVYKASLGMHIFIGVLVTCVLCTGVLVVLAARGVIW